MKLITYESSTGHTSCRADHVVPCGIGSSNTMTVIAMAITASLNASMRPVGTGATYKGRPGPECGSASGEADQVLRVRGYPERRDARSRLPSSPPLRLAA